MRSLVLTALTVAAVATLASSCTPSRTRASPGQGASATPGPGASAASPVSSPGANAPLSLPAAIAPVSATVDAPAAATAAVHVFDGAPAGKRALVLWTAGVQGYVEPCGCTGDPLGGVARLAAAVTDAHRAYDERVLFVDGGDMLFEHLDDNAVADSCQASARADLLVSTEQKLGLAATVRGPLDDVRGADFRDQRLARAKIPSLGVPRKGELAGGPGFVRDVGGVRIGVLGFRADDAASVDEAHEDLHDAVNVITHVDNNAKDLTARVVDAVIVIAQSPREITKKVVAGIPGIDVVIQGRAPGEVPIPPEKLDGGAVLVAAGMQGQYLGVLELNLDGRTRGDKLALDDAQAQADAKSKVLNVRVHELEQQVTSTPDGPRKQFLAQRLDAARAELAALAHTSTPATGPSVKVRALPLPRGFPEDAAVASALAAYQKSIPALVTSCEQNITCPAPKTGDATYLGARACKACHEAQYAFWQAQTVKLPGKDKAGRPIERVEGHAHAWQTLVVDEKEKDRGCVACHSVGFGAPGGACKTGDVVKNGLDGVQCESCHGPGSVHARTSDAADIRGKPDEALCRTCHHVPHIPTTESFVFNDRLKLILGAGHGAARLAQLRGAP